MATDKTRRIRQAEQLLSMADGPKATDEELDRMAGDVLAMVATEPVERLEAIADDLDRGEYEDRVLGSFIREQVMQRLAVATTA